MNKDVIYIEPEQDITDILANIKASKHKIIALVPPKKAGVLRSAVNFKLIAKTARQNEKTVVLITTDEALHRLANSVSMPTAKSLQSKPQLPDDDDATEFGDEEEEEPEEESEPEEEPEDEAVEDEESEEEPEKPAPKPAANKKIPVAAAVKVSKKKPANDDVIEGEPEPEPEEDKKPETKSEKKVAKMKGAKVPNFAKYRKFIIGGAIILIVIIGLSIWMNVVAPAAKITVKVHTTAENFTEKVSFVNDESKSKPKEGVFYIEEKTVTKKAEGDFKATGQVDKGTKASGTVTIVRPKGDTVNCDEANSGGSSFSIPKGTVVTIAGKEFIISDGGSANASTSKDQITSRGFGSGQVCSLKEDISSGALKVVAKEVGDSYNLAAGSETKLSLNTTKKYTVTSSAMTGGSSKKVTVVSKEDVNGASSGLEMSSQNEVREELAKEFGADYILLGTMKQSDPKITTSPALNEEVGENVTPKIVKEVTYTLYAVQREQVKSYITEIVSAKLGDNTQEIYDTGIDKAFFESFKDSDNDNSAKLKTTTKTGPRVTDEMVREKALGKKVGEVQSLLKSIKGVSSVKVDTSYFFVMNVPEDTNKVEINIELEK